MHWRNEGGICHVNEASAVNAYEEAKANIHLRREKRIVRGMLLIMGGAQRS